DVSQIVTDQMKNPDTNIYSVNAEYIPRGMEMFLTYDSIADFKKNLTTNECSLLEKASTAPAMGKSYSVSCDNSSMVTLPEIISSYHRITVNNSPVDCLRGQEYPYLCGVQINQSGTNIEVINPTLMSMAKKIIQRNF
uniref:hypothetical protein n=1 Tax=Pseudomonas aeruginosa TaxID=287 RepID=UPI001C0BE6B8